MRNRLDALPPVTPKLSALGIPLELICENLLRGILITDVAGKIVYVNSTFCELTGYAVSEAIGQNPRILKSGFQPPSFYQDMWKSIKRMGHWQGEIRNKRKTGELYTEWLTISTLRTAAGHGPYYLGVFSDISKQKKIEEATWHRAHHDELTELPTRSLFTAHLKQALTQAKRNKTILAVFFMDLDHLKEVNDGLGHLAGDELLRGVARRIRSSIREGDIVARFGGDEFVLMLPNISRHADIVGTASKILTSLRRPFWFNGKRINGTVSLGISVYPDDGWCVEKLISHADSAMYLAKQGGRDQLRFFLSPANPHRPTTFSKALKRWENTANPDRPTDLSLLTGEHPPIVSVSERSIPRTPTRGDRAPRVIGPPGRTQERGHRLFRRR